MNKEKNLVVIHEDKKHITVMSAIEVFGYEFVRKFPMDFTICDSMDPEVSAYLEIGKEGLALHECEPILQAHLGYQSDGKIVELSMQDNQKQILEDGIYPLKPDRK